MPHVGSLRWLGHIQVRAPVMGRWVGPGVCPSLFRPAPGRRQPESHWGRTGLLLTPDPTSSCSWARKDRAVSGLSTPHYTLLNLSCPYLPPQPTRLHYPKEQFSILAAIRITWEALQKKKTNKSQAILQTKQLRIWREDFQATKADNHHSQTWMRTRIS